MLQTILALLFALIAMGGIWFIGTMLMICWLGRKVGDA